MIMKTVSKFIEKVKTEINYYGWKKIKGQIHKDFIIAKEFIIAGEKPPIQFINRISSHITFLSEKNK